MAAAAPPRPRTTTRTSRDLIEQLLFTVPGERVNRPDFGCGLMQLVFAPNSVELAATLQALVQGALQQWLGNLMRIDEVSADERGRDAHGRGALHGAAHAGESQIASFTRKVTS